MFELFANWKSVHDLAHMARLLAKIKEGSEGLTVFPAYPYLWPVSKILPLGVGLGAQDVSDVQTTRVTGEVTVNMLAELGVRHVLLGHSERRVRGEGRLALEKKLQALAGSAIVPVLICGQAELNESAEAMLLMLEQLPSFQGFSQAWLAYEPYQAIGGQAVPAEHVASVLKRLAEQLITRYPECEIRFMYGGGVTAENLEAFLAMSECQGLLVGSSSLDEKQWERLLSKCKMSC